MPANVAKLLIPNISKAENDGALWIGIDDAAELCARLAIEGERDAAIDLADGLFLISGELQLERLRFRGTHFLGHPKDSRAAMKCCARNSQTNIAQLANRCRSRIEEICR